MTGTKMISFGFFLAFIGLSAIAILCIPGAPFTLAAVLTGITIPEAGLSPIAATLSPGFFTLKIGIIASLILLLLGVFIACMGLFRKN